MLFVALFGNKVDLSKKKLYHVFLMLDDSFCRTDPDLDELITILERKDHVCQIHFLGVDLQSGKTMVAMQEPFPELTDLVLKSNSIPEKVLSLPDLFLSGSAPRLRNLLLLGVPFPGLPKLLLTATHLVNIQLHHIPHSGYFSPEALVTALSTSTGLRLLVLTLQFSPNLESRRPPPTRSLLPVLDTLIFQGAGEYLDDLLARVDVTN